MLNLDLPAGASDVLSILCVGAHCDDIEIGCGGTLLELTGKRPARITWLVLTSDPERAAEARRSAGVFLAKAVESRLVIKEHRDGFLPYLGPQVKDEFEAIKGGVEPDLVFTHYRDDLHQDHRLVSELTWNTFRDHLILEYEVPKVDGDLGQPNAFSLLPSETCQRKVTALLESYPSQAAKKWFRTDVFMALMSLRGLEGCSPSGLAEAFHCRKLNLRWGGS